MKLLFNSIRHRLRSDHQLASLVIIAAAAGITLLPFGIYRLVQAEWRQAAVDIGAEALILALTVFAWRTGRVRLASRVLIYTNSLAVVVSAHRLGLAGVFWIFPITVANFFLVDRHHAFLASLALMGGVLALATGDFSPLVMASLIASALAAISVVYTFAYRVNVQREQLETLAALDALTGLFNRRIFQEECERHRRAMAREGTPCGLLVMDLDHFKSINDSYGHEAGDRVLVEFARLLQHSVRKTDRLFRHGGEEFAALVSPATGESLASMGEHLRHETERSLAVQGRPVTLSIGAALLCAGESSEQWFARADQALYRAKHQGRNQVVLDERETITRACPAVSSRPEDDSGQPGIPSTAGEAWRESR